MEGATGAVVAAFFLQVRHAPGNDFDDVRAMQQIVDKGLRDESGHKRYCSLDHGLFFYLIPRTSNRGSTELH